MEEKKDLEPKVNNKETAKKTTTRKVTAQKPTSKKSTTTTKTASTSKKNTSGTVKKTVKTTTTKSSATNQEAKDKIVKTEKVEVPKEEKIELSKQEERLPKATEVKKEQIIKEKVVEEPKFKPAPKVEKKKKKHTALKAILIFVIIILALVLIHFVRNYIIMNDILTKREALKKLTNYSYVSNQVQNDVKIEYYKKDKTYIMVYNKDTRKNIVWSNLDTRETIFINPQELTATIQQNVSKDTQESFNSLMPSGIAMSSEESRATDFLYWITSEKINGKDCYKVKWISGDETAWYDKENGTLVKLLGGWYSADTDEPQVIEYSDWKFNEVTDEDVTRPNLMGYTVDTHSTQE